MNPRILYSSGSARGYLPEPNSDYHHREVASARTSPSARRYAQTNVRRNSKPDHYLQPARIPSNHASRSQEDIRSSAAYNNGLSHRRPSPKYDDRARDRLLPYLLPGGASSHLTDDDDDRNTSTDDDLDVPEPRQRPRAPSDSRLAGGHYYGGSSATDDRSLQTNSRPRVNTGDPEFKERQRRAEHRRASLHLETLRNSDDYSRSYAAANGHAILRNDVAPHSPSPHQTTNPTIQLHFGGNKVKDYNQYSTKKPGNSSTTSSSSSSSSAAVPASSPKDIPINSAFHRLNCHVPSGHQYSSYY